MNTDKTNSEELKKIHDEITHLTSSPLYQERQQNNAFPVIGEGDPAADIMFVGEAPGKHEAQTGRPFCGSAGRILDTLLQHNEIPRHTVYITNIIKDRPPHNRDPKPEEIELYAPYLDRQIHSIKPRIIATLGRFSMKYILTRYGTTDMIKPISKNHGTVYTIHMSYGNIVSIPLFHPIATIYNKSTKQALEEDFAKCTQYYTTISSSIN